MNWDVEQRRRFVRAEFPCEINISGHPHRTISTHTINISAGGIRVILAKRIVPLSIITLDIKLAGKRTITCKAKVAWAFPREYTTHKKELLFDTGIEFYRIKEADAETINDFVETIFAGAELLNNLPQQKEPKAEKNPLPQL